MDQKFRTVGWFPASLPD